MSDIAAKEIWQFIFDIPLGKIVGWIVVICTILSGLCLGVIKLYKIFLKYSALRRENKDQKEKLEKHDELFTEIWAGLDEIKTWMKGQEAVSYKQLKYTIVRICDEAIANKYITAGQLAFLEEMYQDYVDIFNGNGYCKTLMTKVRTLPVYGDEVLIGQ